MPPRPRFDRRAPVRELPNINDRISYPNLRVVDADGSQLGVITREAALEVARDRELDLVLVSEKADPPVCRIMDYGKYKYEAAQKAKESRKKSTNVVVKEMKYRPKIGMGDFDTKTKKVEQFLNEGHKVKITIMFRGREMQHPELGRKILDQVAEAVTEVAKVEIYPRLDGRNMTMVLGPDKKAQAAAEKRRHTDDSDTPATSTPVEPDATESAPVEPVASEPVATPIEATEPVAIDEA